MSDISSAYRLPAHQFKNLDSINLPEKFSVSNIREQVTTLFSSPGFSFFDATNEMSPPLRDRSVW
jgi:hypothetical protein